MNKFLLILSIFLFSCAPGPIKNYSTSDEIRILAEGLFPEENLNRLSFGLADIVADGNIMGACDVDAGVIAIQRSAWASMTNIQREIVIAHEVGHCAFNRSHNIGVIHFQPQSCPDSIMYPGDILQSCWYMYRDYYLMELRK